MKKLILMTILILTIIAGTCVGFDEEMQDDIKGVVKSVKDTTETIIRNIWDEGVWDQSVWGE